MSLELLLPSGLNKIISTTCFGLILLGLGKCQSWSLLPSGSGIAYLQVFCFLPLFYPLPHIYIYIYIYRYIYIYNHQTNLLKLLVSETKRHVLRKCSGSSERVVESTGIFYCKLCVPERTLCFYKHKLLDEFIKHLSSKKHLSKVRTLPLSFCCQYTFLTILGKSRKRVLLIVVNVT